MILARNSITVSIQRDIDSSWRFYKIAPSTATPSAPTDAQGKAFIANHSTLPSGWTLSEPSYDGTSTNSLYCCDLTGFTDGDVSWSPVSKSTSYEAAKAAYNKAAAALDAVSPIATKTYTNVYCTANSDPAAWLYFASVKPENYYVPWTIRYKVYASIDSLNEGKQTSEVLITGSKSTYYSYQTNNSIINTSYRPLYAHILYTLTQAGVTNGYGHLLGIRFQSAYSPNSSSYARTIKIEVLEAENCEVTVADSMYLYSNAAGSGSTNYSTRTGFDGTTQGVTMAGDRNTNNTQHSPVIAGANGVRPYSLIMRDTETTWVSLYSSVYNGASQGKVRYEGGLKLGEILYSSGSGNYASGVSTSTTYSAYNVDLRYSMNMAAAGAASYKPVYLVGEVNDDGLFYLDEDYWTDDPTDVSGKVYVFIGTCSNNYSGGKGYNAWLASENTAYTFYDGEFIRYEDAQAYEAKKTATNYLSSDNTGIMVADLKDGEQTPSTATGRNVKIDNETVDIRDGQRVLAQYGENTLIGDPTDYHVGIGTANYAEVDLSNLSWSTRYTGSINKTLSTSLPTAYEGYEEKIRIICENYSLKGFVGGVGSLSTPDTHDVGFYGYKNASNPRSATIYLVVPVNHSPSGKMVYNTADPDTTPSIKLYSEGQEVLAKFGQSVSIGDASRRHIEIDETGFQTKLNEDTKLIFIGVINDPDNNNYAEILERQKVTNITASGENFIGFRLNSSCVQLLDVKYGNTSILNLVTLFEGYDSIVKFTSSGSTYFDEYVTVRYYTNELVPCFHFGLNNTSKSKHAAVFGTMNEVYASYALATGYGCKIYGRYSVAEGYEASAIGDASHAEGYGNDAIGYASHAEGYHTEANGDYSHAEGDHTEANSFDSHAEGTYTEANGVDSHAEGDNTAANGQCSHAEGSHTEANGNFSHAQNFYTRANGDRQTAMGRYNAIDNSGVYALIIGNGTSDGNRSNAFAVKWDGTPVSPVISYSPNDTFSVTQLNVFGVMAVTNTTVILSLETDKYMDQVSTVTVTSLVGALRGVKGYIDGSRYDTNWITSAYTVTATKKSRKHVEIRITKPNSAAFTNATTDTPLSLYATMTLTFTT